MPLYSHKENKNNINNAVTIPFLNWREIVNGKPDSIDQVLALKNNDNTKGNLYNYINSITLSWINRNHIQFIFNTSWKEEEKKWEKKNIAAIDIGLNKLISVFSLKGTYQLSSDNYKKTVEKHQNRIDHSIKGFTLLS